MDRCDHEEPMVLENCRTALWLFRSTRQGASSAGDRHSAVVCWLTFELTGATRQAAQGRLAKMYSVPPSGPAWTAVACPVE